MEFRATQISGCFEITPKILSDNRGSFVKTFNETLFRENGLNVVWSEEYYSISKKNVIRGMHFQLPPYEHEKLVYCVQGKALDIIVDLRRGSPTYGKHAKIILNSEIGNMLYLPKGLAHGFKSLSDNLVMMYKVSTVYHPEVDSGVLWSSCNVDWELEGEVIISERDYSLLPFDSFDSPF